MAVLLADESKSLSNIDFLPEANSLQIKSIGIHDMHFQASINKGLYPKMAPQQDLKCAFRLE